MSTKPIGHLGKPLDRKSVIVVKTPEFQAKITKDIKADYWLKDAEIEIKEDKIYLLFKFVCNVQCEYLISICKKHRALFFLSHAPFPYTKFVIYQRPIKVSN